MKFKIKRIELSNALNKVTKAVSSKSPLPILTGIKFDLQEDQLILTGSDADITIQTTIDAKEDLLDIEEIGQVVLNSRYISEIVRKIDSEFITFSILDGSLTQIKGENSEFNLNGSKAIDYPTIDLSKTGTHLTLHSMTIKTFIEQTIFATSDKETRPILTGVNFKASGHQMQCVATDSYRLSKKVIDLMQEDVSFNITIPAKSLNEISKIIDKNEDVDLYISDRKVLFVFDHLIIQTRLIDGAFPDTSRLIPTQFDYKLTINTRDILNAIDRASLFSIEMNNIIKLEMNEDQVLLTSSSQEIGSVEEDLSSGFYKGQPLSISFSAKYAADAIRATRSQKIVIEFTGEMKPFIIHDMEESDLLQLVLPVRTY